jgi:hypothetical protein
MQPFEIYLVKHPWNNCEDARPWLVIDLRQGLMVGCFPIATDCYGGSCFFISSSHPDFAATGLDHDSNIHDSHILDVPWGSFIKKRGELVGQLLADFRLFSGI